MSTILVGLSSFLGLCNAVTIMWLGSFCDCLDICVSNKNTIFGDPVFPCEKGV